MFCNQCEQTIQGKGCTGAVGVCGKNEDVQSLQEMLLYGLKGMAAYAHHARRLGKVDEAVDAFVEEALFATVTNVNFDVPSLLEMVLECGRKNLRVMEMLDEGHVERFGAPSPATMREGTQAGPGILVTGHDMVDLANLLKQCEGTGVKVYALTDYYQKSRVDLRTWLLELHRQRLLQRSVKDAVARGVNEVSQQDRIFLSQRAVPPRIEEVSCGDERDHAPMQRRYFRFVERIADVCFNCLSHGVLSPVPVSVALAVEQPWRER